MAPKKRRQEFTSDNDEEDEDASFNSDREDDEEERSTASASKRPRLDIPRTPSSEEANQSEEESRPSSQADDDEDLEEVLTQAAELRKKNNGANTVAEGGVIKQVICENFMCHDYLDIPLGPCMNFIIGHNGSGKSAVLTALTLCLGGKVLATNRGTSLKSFIKEGRGTARVTVKLSNGGDGHRVDAYGDVIVIQRVFSRDGGSSYLLKSKAGKVVSRKREEVDAITDFYGLQVDNPMTILTQDNARAFLNESTNAQKYKFFNQGVQLEQLDQDYSLIAVAIKNAEAMLELKKEAVAALKKKRDQAKETVKQFDSQASLNQRYDDLVNRSAWLQVRDRKAALKAHEDVMEIHARKIAAAEKERDKASADFDAANLELENIKAQIEEATTLLEPIEDEKAQKKEQLSNNRSELLEYQRQQRETKGEMVKTDRKIAECKSKIRSEEDRLEEQNGGSSTRLMDSIKAFQVEVDDLKSQRSQIEAGREDRGLDHHAAVQAKNEAETRVSAKQKEIDSKRQLFERLDRAGSDPLGGFHPKMKHLLDAIDNERGFREKPIGPLGMYMSLKKPQWSSIVEKFFGNKVNGFVVASHEDGKLLDRVIKRAGLSNVPYFVVPREKITIEEPAANYDTMLRVLDIRNEAVRTQLIIFSGIEQVVLIENLREANNVMAARSPEDRISSCYALNRSRPGWGHKVGGSYGVMSVTPISPWSGMARIKSQGMDQRETVRTSIRYLEEELRVLQSAAHSAGTVEVERRRAVQSAESRRKELVIEIQRKEEKIERLNNKIEEIAVDGELNVLQQDLKLAEEDREHGENTYRDLETNIARMNAAQAVIEGELRSLQQDLDRATQQVKSIQDEYTRINGRRTKALSRKNDLLAKLDQFEAVEQELQAKKEELNEMLQTHTDQAQGVCDEVPVPDTETMATLDKKLTKVRNDILTSEKRIGCSKEEAVKALLKFQKDYEASKNEWADNDRLLVMATNVMMERRRRWELFQSFISIRARAQFSHLMSERAFKGRLRLEHNERPPQLIIEAGPSGEKSGKRGPKTLSGGERSFSTICLLLALWEAMGSPLRCLDEFDVYMDHINRSISVEMMLKAAERSAGKQFILITPQNMNQVTSTRCKIFRLSDPERDGRLQTRIA